MSRPPFVPKDHKVLTYSEELAMEFCSRMLDNGGRSLSSVCRDPDMPIPQTIFSWFRKHPEFHALYLDAVQARADLIFEEMLDIADTTEEGQEVTERQTEEGTFTTTKTFDRIAHRSLKIDTRKWMLTRMAPRKYGDKLQVGGAADLPPVSTVDVTKLSTQALAELMALYDAAPPR